MKNNNGLVLYAKAQLGLPYWYGTFGQTACPTLLNSKRKQYPSYYTATDFNTQYNKRVHDCVGLIKGYLWSETHTSKPKYNASQDVSASGMYKNSTTKGDMSTFPALNGTLVYKKSGTSISHVGIYCVDGYVYEAKGHKYGVVKTLFNKDSWVLWSLCPYIDYCDYVNNDDASKKSNDDIANEVIAGRWGNGTERKNKLTSAGYNYREIQDIVNKKLRG